MFFSGMLLVGHAGFSQVAKTTTENYKADFEKSIDISQFLDYEGKQIPIQILKAGISEEMYEMFPELKEKRVGLGVANISMEYLENLNRFKFTEDKTEIKNRMVKQFQASQAGISENKLDGRGKINLAEYFVTIECYDYSISEDESVSIKGDTKQLLVTRIGLQVRFTNAETGTVISGSGLGEAKTTKETSGLTEAERAPNHRLGQIEYRSSRVGIGRGGHGEGRGRRDPRHGHRRRALSGPRPLAPHARRRARRR